MNPGFVPYGQRTSADFMTELGSILGGIGGIMPAAPPRQFNLAGEWDQILAMQQASQPNFNDKLMMLGSAIATGPTFGQGLAQGVNALQTQKIAQRDADLRLRLARMQQLSELEDRDFQKQMGLAGLGLQVADAAGKREDRDFARTQAQNQLNLGMAELKIRAGTAMAQIGASGAQAAESRERLKSMVLDRESREEREAQRRAGLFVVKDEQITPETMLLEGTVHQWLGKAQQAGEKVFDEDGKLTPDGMRIQQDALMSAQQKLMQQQAQLATMSGRGGMPRDHFAEAAARGLATAAGGLEPQKSVDTYLQNLNQIPRAGIQPQGGTPSTTLNDVYRQFGADPYTANYKAFEQMVKAQHPTATPQQLAQAIGQTWGESGIIQAQKLGVLPR